MKERVFIKKNIFTSVMFGAVFLFVLFESIFYRDNLSGIAFLISIPIFILSLIKIIIDISEDINEAILIAAKRQIGIEVKRVDICSYFEEGLYEVKRFNK